MMSKTFKLAYILGSGHCGSTLLNLLLNGHSQMIGLSEIERIGHYTTSIDETFENRLQAQFWQKVKYCYEATSEQPFEKIDITHPALNELWTWREMEIARWSDLNDHVLSCIANQSRADILIDASKFWQRLYLLYKSGQFDLKVIHLVRDGRAVINSYLRKYGRFKIAVRRWLSPSLIAFYLRQFIPKQDWLQITYEDLARQPEKVLKRICIFLEVEYEPGMLAYKQHPDFGIGGNRLRNRKDETIVLDKSWKKELKLAHRITFSLMVGWLNWLYGYGF